MVCGLRQIRRYILAHRTIVRSDHAALMYLKRAREPVGQQASWLDFIEQFTLDLQHRNGASHNNADALSRRPCERQGDPCRQCSGRSDGRQRGLCGDKGSTATAASLAARLDNLSVVTVDRLATLIMPLGSRR